LLSTVPWLIIDLLIWYFASIRGSLVAICLIGLMIASQIYLLLAIPSEIWIDRVRLFLTAFPLFLLVASFIMMVTPSAFHWRRYRRFGDVSIFE
jgi:hypothetical protein